MLYPAVRTTIMNPINKTIEKKIIIVGWVTEVTWGGVHQLTEARNYQN